MIFQNEGGKQNEKTIVVSFIGHGDAADDGAHCRVCGGGGDSGTSNVQINKTATDLDENDKTEVTLTVGAGEDKENVAVLFLLDKSTSQGMRDEAAEMLDELKTKVNTNIKYDVVIFSGTATATGWQDIQDATTLESVKSNFVNKETTSGTNMSAGIYKAASEMANLSEGYTTYLVALSDGITYVWSEGDDG